MMHDTTPGYQPMDCDTLQRLNPFCLADPLFCVLYIPLLDAEAETGLAPEEVWCEALAVSVRLGRSPRPDLALRQEQRYLGLRYTELVHPDDARIAVLTVLLFMLAAVPAEVQGEAYARLLLDVSRQLNGHPLHESLCASIRRSEEAEEAEGRFVGGKNYLKESAIPLAIGAEETGALHADDLVDEALRSASVDHCDSLLALLSDYDYRHGHAIEPQINRLREGLGELRRRATEARKMENYGIYNEQVGSQHLGLPAADLCKLIEKTA